MKCILCIAAAMAIAIKGCFFCFDTASEQVRTAAEKRLERIDNASK